MIKKWLSVVFIPPLYFGMRKQWGAFALNTVIYLLAVFTVLIGVGIFFWVAAVIHAGIYFNLEMYARRNERIAARVRDELRSEQGETKPQSSWRSS